MEACIKDLRVVLKPICWVTCGLCCDVVEIVHFQQVLSQVTQDHYLCHVRVLYNMSKCREHMGRSLGLEIC